jgi:hypothetical protein
LGLLAILSEYVANRRRGNIVEAAKRPGEVGLIGEAYAEGDIGQ